MKTSTHLLNGISQNLSDYSVQSLEILLTYYQARKDAEKVLLLENELKQRQVLNQAS